eukprot:scaffold1629_cov369-Prasinococcus_capsulatus_cf.AAC.36
MAGLGLGASAMATVGLGWVRRPLAHSGPPHGHPAQERNEPSRAPHAGACSRGCSAARAGARAPGLDARLKRRHASRQLLHVPLIQER